MPTMDPLPPVTPIDLHAHCRTLTEFLRNEQELRLMVLNELPVDESWELLHMDNSDHPTEMFWVPYGPKHHLAWGVRESALVVVARPKKQS